VGTFIEMVDNVAKEVEKEKMKVRNFVVSGRNNSDSELTLVALKRLLSRVLIALVEVRFEDSFDWCI
jgi:hypothetical protein